MGIGNTASSALLVHRLAPAPLEDCIGLGAGQDDPGMARKRAAIAKAAARSDANAPLDVLSEFGGLETYGLSRKSNVVPHADPTRQAGST